MRGFDCFNHIRQLQCFGHYCKLMNEVNRVTLDFNECTVVHNNLEI